MARMRADVLMVERGLAESREAAQRLIMAGRVRTGTTVLVKAATQLDPAAPLQVTLPDRYVSRGGLKLEAAIDAFELDAGGLRCVDLGASTGGFTDCLLQHGAGSVVAVDVGRAQLHQRLREDPRVRLLEGTNARDLPDVGLFDFFVADLSFISVRKVLPAVARRARSATRGVVLLKPQFEAGPADVPRGGVIRDVSVRERVLAEFLDWARSAGWTVRGWIECPVRGGDGNVEYLVDLQTPDRPGSSC